MVCRAALPRRARPTKILRSKFSPIRIFLLTKRFLVRLDIYVYVCNINKQKTMKLDESRMLKLAGLAKKDTGTLNEKNNPNRMAMPGYKKLVGPGRCGTEFIFTRTGR